MKIYLFFAFITFSTLSQGQNITGTYRLKDGIKTFTFLKSSFNENNVDHLATGLGVGTYTINNKLLILKYQKVPNQDTSRYEIYTTNNSLSSINLKVFDSDGIPLVGLYGCNDNKNNRLNYVLTNIEGKDYMVVSQNSLIGYFIIDALGYHRISIPIKTLMGKTADITAYLLPVTKYYVEPQTVRYKILKITKEKLVLLENNQTLVFEKVK